MSMNFCSNCSHKSAIGIQAVQPVTMSFGIHTKEHIKHDKLTTCVDSILQTGMCVMWYGYAQ